MYAQNIDNSIIAYTQKRWLPPNLKCWPIRNGSFHHPCYSRSQAYATKENDAVSTKGDYTFEEET